MCDFFVSEVENHRTSFRNSFLADRVRVLKVWPGALGNAIHTMTASKKPLKVQRHSPTASDPHARPPGSLGLLVNKVFKRRTTPTDTSLPPPPDVLPPPDKRKELFFDAISRLHRVHELRMYYHEEHDGRSFLPECTTRIWSVHGRNIRRLVIELPVHNAMDIVPLRGALEILEELELILRSNPSDASAKAILCAFVNGLAPTLHSLSLRFVTYGPSSLIESLGSFPHLKKLSIPMPLDEYHRPDHSRLRRFLSENDTLRDLYISYPSCCSPLWRAQPIFHQIQVMVSCPDTTLPELCSLELSLRSPALISREAIDLFAGLSQNLTSLTLTSRAFSFSEIDTILLSFENHKLKELSLFSELLSATLMDTFVRRCPELIKLVLEIEDVVGSQAASLLTKY
jgi:hypothetical protein